MKQFFVHDILTTDTLGKILQQHQSTNVPLLKKRYNYYMGKHPILLKTASDEGKPNNRIVCNFIHSIITTYCGYAVGITPTYSSDQDIDDILEVLNYNDVSDEDSELFREGLIFGQSAEINYIDKYGKQRFKVLDPMTIIPVYDDTLDGELLYAIRYWQDDLADELTPQYYVEVYDNSNVTLYKSDMGFSSFTPLGERKHNYNQVPVTFFSLNKELTSLAEQVFGLQDMYNSLMSDSVDDWDAFVDAYLVIKGCGASDDEISEMKQHRVLLLDNDSDAQFLTKSTADTEINNLLNLCESKIREMSACPNFADEAFGTSSGIALEYKLLGMENNVAEIMTAYKKALQKRIELITSIGKLLNGDDVWRDIDIKFTRNIPVDYTAQATMINGYRGLVSTETLLGQVPFVTDVSRELERLKAEKEEELDIFEGEWNNGYNNQQVLAQ